MLAVEPICGVRYGEQATFNGALLAGAGNSAEYVVLCGDVGEHPSEMIYYFDGEVLAVLRGEAVCYLYVVRRVEIHGGCADPVVCIYAKIIIVIS